ncbi:MAG: hypothetical protein ACJ754_28840 [Pyrinomonadaceae bacterium]
MSLSLALGILVCNMSGYGFLTTAHACGGSGGSTVIGNTLLINNALAPDGVAFRNILVNGQIIEAGVIAGPVQFVSSSVVNANGVIVGNEVPGAQPSGSDDYGVLVGNEVPCTDGVLVGNEVPNGGGGAPVGGNPATLGVLVGNELNVNGLIVSSSGTATGGILTGDNLTVSGGVITGQNLLISGSTIDGGFISMSGSITGVSTPSGN